VGLRVNTRTQNKQLGRAGQHRTHTDNVEGIRQYQSLTQLHIHRVYYYCLCALAVRVTGYTTEMYCASCEVRTEFIYVM
jgi:hypothetical protein